MNINKVPKNELINRMKCFTTEMDKVYSDWEMCAITDGMSMYYLTGTICDGVLLIQRNGNNTLWIRRSYERAVIESEFCDIKHMSGFRDIASNIGELPDTIYLDMASATLEWYGILSKYMKFKNVLPVDNIMLKVRSVKSPYEIEIIKQAGSTIERLLTSEFFSFLHEGISEAELGADLFSLFIKNGYHGVSRFSMKNADVSLGHVGFSESPLYPSVFNGASGIIGLCPAAPVLGSRDVRLKEGDLIYIDIGFGLEGYNVDKTLIYSYKKQQPSHVEEAHNHCIELEKQAVSKLCAGAIPSEIYSDVYNMVDPKYLNSFMGSSGRTVPFLGHGVGLYIDEWPVIAKGFNQPLECGMTIAIEPKIGIKGVGMVGSENTYLITESGAVSLTGNPREIILCC